MEPTNDEWASRRLCPDGACVGVIGPGGRCKVCGALSPEGPIVAASSDEDGAEDPQIVAAAAAPADGDDAFDDDRELCPDGGCIGVIGQDGRCKVCGLAAGAAR